MDVYSIITDRIIEKLEGYMSAVLGDDPADKRALRASPQGEKATLVVFWQFCVAGVD